MWGVSRGDREGTGDRGNWVGVVRFGDLVGYGGRGRSGWNMGVVC